MKSIDIHILAESGLYKGKRLRATLEETHISWILLTNDLVFKIKKPVKLSFLDFSRLSVRKFLCEKELKLNRRFSSIYINILPIKQDDGCFRIGSGKGKIVDYAVVMMRQSSENRMDHMLSQGKVGRDDICLLGEKIADLHRNAPVIPLPFNEGYQRETFNDIKSIRSFIKKHSQEQLHIIDEALAFGDIFVNQYGDRMSERVQLGFRRDVHGDLHCGNIFINKEPVIFDCIEYNDAFRQIDVLSDIAFLCMDLEAFGEESLSELFLSTYSDRFPAFQDPRDQQIFLYYKCLRANIRAKVNAASARESEGSAAFREYQEATEKYLHLMKKYISRISFV